MRQFRRIISVFILSAVPFWSIAQLIRNVPRAGDLRTLQDGHLSRADIAVVVHLMVVVAWLLLVREIAAMVNERGEKGSRWSLLNRVGAWLAASCALAPAAAVPHAHAQTATVPAGDVLSPVVAAGVISHILRRRREQVGSRGSPMSPVPLTDENLETLWRVRSEASRHTVSQGAIGIVPQRFAVDPDVRRLLDNVDEVECPSPDCGPSVVDAWAVVVRVYGYPCVENRLGVGAKFRKRRALELVTWLALNRERSRRSAARNAMWDVPINDSTFSTIVSDMRRSLAEIDGSIDHDSWCPTTFSDEILLSTRVTTDAEILHNALARFRSLGTPDTELEYELSRIRDLPFAGTTYSWADLDGTTTRLIIQATQAAEEVATWSLENDCPHLLQVATAAGLRVMPGNEELLRLQAKALPATRARRVVSVP